MQTEKEFKELAQAWIEDAPEATTDDIEFTLELMWRSYNQAIKDYIRQDS